MIQGYQKVLSSKLIMNSRQPWNSHQRHKFWRAGENLESWKSHFQGFSIGIFHCGCHAVKSEYMQEGEHYAVEMSQAFHGITRFKCFTDPFNVFQNWENRCFTILFDGAYFLLAIMIEEDKSSHLRMGT